MPRPEKRPAPSVRLELSASRSAPVASAPSQWLLGPSRAQSGSLPGVVARNQNTKNKKSRGPQKQYHMIHSVHNAVHIITRLTTYSSVLPKSFAWLPCLHSAAAFSLCHILSDVLGVIRLTGRPLKRTDHVPKRQFSRGFVGFEATGIGHSQHQRNLSPQTICKHCISSGPKACTLLHVSDHASRVIDSSCICYSLMAIPQTLYPLTMLWRAGIFDSDLFGKLQLSAKAKQAIHSGKSLHI